MTKLKALNEQRKDIKNQMKISSPLRGYLGNQYNYWKDEFNKINNKIKEFQNQKHS